jgi:hypothetical protein
MKKWANELKRVFSKKEGRMAKKTPEKMPTIPDHKGMQIKTTLRFHSIPI